MFALNYQTFRVPLYPVVAEQGWLSIFAGINSHPAVSALGHDFLLSAVSFLRWRTVSRSLLSNSAARSTSSGGLGVGAVEKEGEGKGSVQKLEQQQQQQHQQQKKNKAKR